MNPAVAQLIAEIAIYGIDIFIADMHRAQQTTDDVWSAIAAGIGRMADGIEQGLRAGIAAISGFIQDAIKEASKVERFKLSYGGLFGDLAKGEKEVDYLRQLAKEVMASSDDLVEAGVRASAAGLNFGHFAKNITTATLLMGGGRGNLMAVTDMYSRIASGGNFGMAIRTARRFGIGYDDFRAEGIKISAGNKITATADEMLRALDRIMEKHGFGRIFDALKNSMAVAFIDLQDSWNILLENFGKAFFPFVTMLIKAISPFVDFLADSGEINKIGKAFADAFSGIFGAAGGERSLIMFLTFMMTAFEMLPGLLRTIGEVIVNTLRAVFHWIDAAFTAVVNNLTRSGLEVANFFRGMTGNFARVALAGERIFGRAADHDDWVKIAAAMKDPLVFKPLTGIGDLLNRGMSAVGGDKLTSSGADFDKRRKQMLDDYDKYMKNPKSALVNPEGEGIWGSTHRVVADATQETARNTAHIAAHMEHFKRLALGGGERGRTGVTVSEMYGTGGRVQVDVRSGSKHLDNYLSEGFTEMQQGMRRAGVRR